MGDIVRVNGGGVCWGVSVCVFDIGDSIGEPCR